ncbi:MAG: DUF362 domain-containing protein, partial [Promethearchaeota archaeon]
MSDSSSKVFVTKTNPDNVLTDYNKLLHLANYQQHYNKDHKVIIKLNLSWSKFFPACSTPPWQLEGLLKTMI